jgi:hypothetical protein
MCVWYPHTFSSVSGALDLATLPGTLPKIFSSTPISDYFLAERYVIVPTSKRAPLKMLPLAVFVAVATHHVKSIWQSWSFQVVEQGMSRSQRETYRDIHRHIPIETVVSSEGDYRMR